MCFVRICLIAWRTANLESIYSSNLSLYWLGQLQSWWLVKSLQTLPLGLIWHVQVVYLFVFRNEVCDLQNFLLLFFLLWLY